MVVIGDLFHNFVDGILIASAFLVDIKLGLDYSPFNDASLLTSRNEYIFSAFTFRSIKI